MAEALILGAFLFLMGVGVVVHEPWFDEAQSWLLGRDASVPDLLTTYLRYEGHPPLWYLVLKIPAAAGLPYKSINVIGASIATIGVILLLLNRAVPLPVKAVLPFTFFVAYQYSIVSRSYVMILPLLLGILAIYPRRRERLWLFVLLLALLCHVSLHATAMAGALVMLYAWELRRDGLPKGTELRKHLLALAALVLNVALIASILRPPTDLSMTSKLSLDFAPRWLIGVLWHGLASNTAGAGSIPRAVLSLLAVVLLAVWFARRGTLATFAMLLLFVVPVASIYFAIWHEGIFFLILVFTIVLTFMRIGENATRFDRAMLAVVVLILLNSVLSTWHSYSFDINNPFSGSASAAEYIKAHHIDRARLFGAGFPCLAIEPYFGRNVFANYRTYGGFTFWDWSKRAPWFYRPYRRLADADVAQLRAWQAAQLAQKPDFILASVKLPSDAVYSQMAAEAGYREIAFFPGALFWRDHIYEEESYRLFIRATAPGTDRRGSAPGSDRTTGQ